MATVTLDRHEAETSDLPRVCLYCGRRADRAVRRKFTWCPVWTVSPILRALMTKSMYVGVPVCVSHAGWQLFGRWGPRAVEITPTKITITKVADDFADALYDYRQGREPVVLDDDEREERRQRRLRAEEERGPIGPAPSGGSGVLWVILGLAFGIPALLCGGVVVALALTPARPNVGGGPVFPPLNTPAAGREPRTEELGLLAVATDGDLGTVPWPALALSLRKEPLLLLDDTELDKTLKALTATDSAAHRDALQRLAKAYPVERRRSEVAAAIEPLTTNWDILVRQYAAQALAVWATHDNVPALLKLLDDRMGPCRAEAMNALAKIKDERGAKPVAARLKDLSDRRTASEALVAMGPIAEPAVCALLKDGDLWTRLEACKVLRKIGTEASVPTLTALQKDPDSQVKKAAQDALQAIAARPVEPPDD